MQGSGSVAVLMRNRVRLHRNKRDVSPSSRTNRILQFIPLVLSKRPWTGSAGRDGRVLKATIIRLTALSDNFSLVAYCRAKPWNLCSVRASSCQIEITSSIKFAGGRGRVSQRSSVILFHSLPKKHSSTERVGGGGLHGSRSSGFKLGNLRLGRKASS